MTAESAQSVKGQSAAGSQQVRIAVLVILAIIVGVVLWLVLGNSKHNKPGHVKTNGIGPIAFTAKNLAAESRYINTNFYWAGPQQGKRYEFTRTTNGFLYVRYLPTTGVKVGNKSAHFLVVATYPFVGAYSALKKEAGSKAVAGPGGSIVYVRPHDRKSVLMAFPKANDQIEIYAPESAVAVATAESGKIKPVR